MRIWTIQSAGIYDNLMRIGYHICDGREVLQYYKRAYRWLGKQMDRKGIRRSEGLEYPIWAWYIYGGKNEKPDLRESQGIAGEELVCIELEIDEKRVCLTDYDAWHMVLNDWWINPGECDEDWEEYEEWYIGLRQGKREREKERSWQRVFDINPTVKYVQATFWELKAEDIVGVEFFSSS